jgi:hypothetical protein
MVAGAGQGLPAFEHSPSPTATPTMSLDTRTLRRISWLRGKGLTGGACSASAVASAFGLNIAAWVPHSAGTFSRL